MSTDTNQEWKEAEPEARDFENAIGFYFALYQYWNRQATRLQSDNQRLRDENQHLENRIFRLDEAEKQIVKYQENEKGLREEVERLKGEEQDMIDMWAKIDNYKARIKELEQGLREAALQLQYVDTRFPTGTTPAVIAGINYLLNSVNAVKVCDARNDQQSNTAGSQTISSKE